MRSLAVVSLAVALALSVDRVASAQPSTLSSYAIFAAQQLKVGSHAALSGGAIGSNGEVRIRTGSAVVGPIVAGQVDLASGASVQGSVYANSLSAPGATIQGAYVSPIALPILTLPPPAAINPGLASLTIGGSATATIPPGSYFQISIGGTAQVTIGGAVDAQRIIARGGKASITCGAALSLGRRESFSDRIASPDLMGHAMPRSASSKAIPLSHSGA